MLRALPTIAAACLLCGCFVFDELEAGEKIMEENSPRAATAPSAAAEPAADGEAPGPQTGEAWWGGARSLNERRETDPDDPKALVDCRLRGKTRFMRRADCLSQGGSAG